MKHLAIITFGFLILIGCGDNQGELVTKSESSSQTESTEAAPAESQLPEGHPPIGGNQNMSPNSVMQPGPERELEMTGNTVVIGPVQFTVGENWVSQQPSSSMRAAQFSVPPKEGDTSPAELAIFRGIGGSNDANIQRWIGQIQTESPDDYTVEKMQNGPFTIQVLDITGSYTNTMGGPMMGGNAETQPGTRMMAASIEGPGGPWHFKLTGDQETVSQNADAFNEMINSLKTIQ